MLLEPFRHFEEETIGAVLDAGNEGVFSDAKDGERHSQWSGNRRVVRDGSRDWNDSRTHDRADVLLPMRAMESQVGNPGPHKKTTPHMHACSKAVSLSILLDATLERC